MWLHLVSVALRPAGNGLCFAPKEITTLVLGRPYREVRQRASLFYECDKNARRLRCDVHNTEHYTNNRAEASRQPTRQRERQHRFKSAVFSSSMLSSQMFFELDTLAESTNHRLLRSRSFEVWRTDSGLNRLLDKRRSNQNDSFPPNLSMSGLGEMDLPGTIV